MSKLESGVSSYVRCVATVPMCFPVDAKGVAYIQCDQCRFYHRSMNRCNLTEEIIMNPSKYVGDVCPLHPIEEENK